ncbi:hypothetical protein TKK_0011620 [Trichogramma kaykai]
MENDNQDEAIYIEDDDAEKKRSSSFWNPKNLNQFMNSCEFKELITDKPQVTHGQLYFMILKFSVTNHLPNSVTNNLIELVNTLFDCPVLPSSKYINNKLLNPVSGVEFHAVCPNCSLYLGEFGKGTLPKTCNVCGCSMNLKQSTDESFFSLINPSSQIKDLLETYEDHYDNVMRRLPNQTCIEDVYDGERYQKFRAELPFQLQNSFITMVINTDGAPKYKSSKKSIWPLYIMVNELPKQDRLNNIICCGLWFNKNKPIMSVFLQKFVDMLNVITTTGIPCKIKNKNITIRPFVVSCCVDAPARAAVQGIKQFNGNYGCNWCLHPGWKDGAMLYPLRSILPQLRTHQETVSIMLNVLEESEAPLGIKYPSPLINLPNFDIIEGMIPDYMHCCLEGVAAKMLDYFLYYMVDKTIEELDDQIENIKPPNQLQRLTRPISERNDWKAREWENFVLYYSIPLLKKHLTKAKFNHWLLFVEGLYIILQDKIEIADLNRANNLFHQFVADMEETHGARAMTYNTHILLHMCRSVFNWGPVWANSTFCFESANKDMLNAIKCARGASHQIVRFVNLNHSLLILNNFLSPIENYDVLRYCNEVLESKLKNAFTTPNGITYFGKYEYINEEDATFLGLSVNSKIYHKIAKNDCKYESVKIKKKKSNNSMAVLENGTYVQILRFLVDEENQKEFLQYHTISTKNFSFSPNLKMKKISQIEKTINTVETKSIFKICVLLERKKGKYAICEVSNLLHY